jgi:hypothetical protein
MFITMCTRALHWFLYCDISIQSITPNPIYLRSSLILFTYLCLVLLSSLFPSGFHTNILYAFLLVLIHAPYSANLILFGLIILITFGKEYNLCSSLCSFPQPPTTSSLFGPNILLNTLLSNILSLFFP